MRRMTAIAAVLTLFSATYSFAAPNEQMQGGMMGSHKMMNHDSTCAMCAMGGMGMKMPRQIVVVEDGIIVSVGNRLIKYDNDLNLKKEVTIAMEADSMKTMRGQMQSQPNQRDTTKQAPAPMKKK